MSSPGAEGDSGSLCAKELLSFAVADNEENPYTKSSIVRRRARERTFMEHIPCFWSCAGDWRSRDQTWILVLEEITALWSSKNVDTDNLDKHHKRGRENVASSKKGGTLPPGVVRRGGTGGVSREGCVYMPGRQGEERCTRKREWQGQRHGSRKV